MCILVTALLVLQVAAARSRLPLRMASTINTAVSSWESLRSSVASTATGIFLFEQEELRSKGEGFPHTDASIRLFGSTEEPRVVYYRDTAAWCPYCQKVWILLEEKKIPYRVEKINMRSYGDKPAEFLRKVPNGLLPAISIDGNFQTDSLPIMLNLDRTFTFSGGHKSMWPAKGTNEEKRAQSLMKLERDLFARWCNLVFRPSLGNGARRMFEEGLDLVEQELGVTSGPWFLSDLSIVDLTFITHIERMCASVPYWSNFLIRGTGRWVNLERWMAAFEALPSYMATKSDYYTHCMDIPPQYGPGYSPIGQKMAFAEAIDGRDGSWRLPLAPLTSTSLEPVSASINPGDEAARHEAAFKLTKNSANVAKFALRGAGKPGAKQFQAPLADPYATPAMEHLDAMDAVLQCVTKALIDGEPKVEASSFPALVSSASKATKEALRVSLRYLTQRVGVPRDMSYPAARQFRAYLLSAEEALQ